MLQGLSESLRDLLMKFSLSFLELGDPWVITTLLGFKGDIGVWGKCMCVVVEEEAL